MGQKVNIDLTVDAHTLYGMENPTTAQIEACCSISDDSPDDPTQTGNIENYTTTVYIDNDVEWNAVLKDKNGADKGYKVGISQIEFEANANDPNDVSFFVPDNFGKDANGKVKNKVKNDSNLINKHEQYKIRFFVENSDGVKKPFPLDPKLKGHG